jgi:hypothetical protein
MNGSGKASSREYNRERGKKETMKQFSVFGFQFPAMSFEHSLSTQLSLIENRKPKTENRKPKTEN